jgi:hypothetical protein
MWAFQPPPDTQWKKEVDKERPTDRGANRISTTGFEKNVMRSDEEDEKEREERGRRSTARQSNRPRQKGLNGR